MDLTPASLSALSVKYSQIFQQAFLRYGINWPKFAQLFESTTETETHVWMDRVPILRKWIGDRVVNNVALRTYSLSNDPYEDTIGLDEFNVRDNKINAFAPAVQNLAEQAKKWGDVLFFGSQQGGANTGAIAEGLSFTTYDGQPFFSASHPVNVDDASFGTQSNLALGSGLTSAAYFTARQTMRSYRGADNMPLNVNPSLLMVPAYYEAQAVQIAQTQWTAPSAALGQNAPAVVQQNPLYGTADVLVAPDMDLLGEGSGFNNTSGTYPWLLMDPSGPVKPFLFQLREAPEFFFDVSPDAESIKTRHQILCGVRTRGAGGYGPYFYAYLGSGV